MASSYIKLPPSAGGGSGAVDSVYGRTGNVIALNGDYTATQITNTPSGNISATNLQDAVNELDTEKLDALQGPTDVLVRTDSSGIIIADNSFQVNPNTKGLSIGNTIEPNNNGGANLNFTLIDIDPLQNSPNEQWTVRNTNINLDPNLTGFQIGSAVNALFFDTNSVDHIGTSDVGSIVFTSNTYNLGNSTDPISVKGIGYFYGQGVVNANVTVNGQLQGYGFQPSFNAASILTQNVSVFYDTANLPIAISGYTTFSSSPMISSIANTTNFNGVSITPTITTFTGNAGFQGIGLFGNLGTFNTGSYQGIAISPTITSMSGTANFLGINMGPNITNADNATGIIVNMSGVTGNNVKAASFDGDVSINGALSFSGALSIGKLTAFATQAVVDGGGSPSIINSLISSPTVGDGLTIANCDTIGLNTAALMTIGIGSTVTSGGLGIGLAALALPAVISIGAGSSLDIATGGAFALSMGGGSGTLDKAIGSQSVFIGDGTTTVNKFYGYKAEILGSGATENWGIYSSTTEYNFMRSLKIDGVVGSTDKVSNLNVGLEIGGTTKALRVSVLTTVQKNALTALAGMVVFDSDLTQLCYYNGTTWIAV
jgi:hypothetical protein